MKKYQLCLYHNIITTRHHKYMEMVTNKKQSTPKQYTVGVDKELRPALMKAIALEIGKTGNRLSVNMLASKLVRAGLKSLYPEALR